MSGPRLLPGAPVPLFDRLVDADIRTPARQGEVMPPLDRDRLILSIALEISALVNTRCPRSRGEMAGRMRTTLDYGVPDLSTFAPFNGEAEASLIHELETAIRAFEPRLIDPRVQLHRLTAERRSAFMKEWSERAGRLPVNEDLRRQGAIATVLPDDHDRRSLLLELTGRILLDGRMEPVAFPVVMHDGQRMHHAA